MMLPMVLTYLLIPFGFFTYFYGTYVKRINKPVRICIDCALCAIAVACLAGTVLTFDVYLSNFTLGVYSSMPSAGFPVDGFAINAPVIALAVLDLIATFKPHGKLASLYKKIDLRGTVRIPPLAYICLLPLAIFAFAFVGDGICGFSAIENALYDPKYVFLMLWVGLVPILNVLSIVIRPDSLARTVGAKACALSGIVGVNLLFFALIVIFEALTPDYMIHIGKPFLIITFSVSLPIEFFIIALIMLTGTLVAATRLILLLVKRK